MPKIQVPMDQTTQKNLENWLQGDYDEASKNEIRRLQKEHPEELIDAFYTHLKFGTGGLRGIMGVGTNRMNNYTIRAATQGLANYILKQASKNEKPRVIVGYDCRHHSKEFAEETARVLAANNIEVFLYKELRPVALVSFGVIHKHCTAGILITASHNPPKYNGYKVYWSDGSQVLPPHDTGIIEEVNKITSNKLVKRASFPNPLIQEVDGEIDKAYLDAIRLLQLHPGNNHSKGKNLHVVYTPLHGAGITIVPKALKDWGFTNLTIVEKQKEPNGDFPTVKSPNPEEKEAMAIGVEELKRLHADILIGTDPDTDRLGVVAMHNNEPFFFTGNEIACILLEHICQSLKAAQQMPPKATFIKTIVTTELFRKIAESYGGLCYDVLTGFKYIGEKITQWEEDKKADVTAHHYIFGGEESYGYLLGTHVRDKDAIISSTCVCESALQMKLKGKTLVDFLYDIYLKYGVFREKLVSLTFEGKEGVEKMQKMMGDLRKNPPKALDGIQVTLFEDYLNRTSICLKTGRKEPLLLPESDVLRFWLEDETKIVIRPSGTEPKIKIYAAVFEKHHAGDAKAMQKAIASCDKRLEKILDYLKKLLLS